MSVPHGHTHVRLPNRPQTHSDTRSVCNLWRPCENAMHHPRRRTFFHMSAGICVMALLQSPNTSPYLESSLFARRERVFTQFARFPRNRLGPEVGLKSDGFRVA